MDRRGIVITAVVLIAIGAYLLLANLNLIPSYSITQLWPGIVVLVGILFWLGYLFGKDHDPGLPFVGTIVTLVGLLFLDDWQEYLSHFDFNATVYEVDTNPLTAAANIALNGWTTAYCCVSS